MNIEKYYVNISELVGQIFDEVVNEDDVELHFKRAGKTIYKFYHSQDCCEDVFIEDIDSPLTVFSNAEILEAEESSKESPKNPDAAWTFYKFRTSKGWVTIRWWGESNGYYSISVNLAKIKED